MRKKLKRSRGRIIALQSFIVAGLGVIALRIVFIQQVFGPRLLKAFARDSIATSTTLAPRGELLANNGQILAQDLPAYTLDIHTSLLGSRAQKFASMLSRQVGLSVSTVTHLLMGNYKWLQWPHAISLLTKQKILRDIHTLYMAPGRKPLNIGDLVVFYPTEQRFYPNGVFASNIIGYVNGEDVGQTGLEARYDSVLQGHDGVSRSTYEADGFPIQSSIKIIQKAVPGDDVRLTIDPTIQGFVENAMNGLVRKYRPAHAAIIVMNPHTGAILAMSARPTFDPNHYQKSSSTALSSNWAVNEPFEPGSTFKPIVLAAALTEHKISLNDTFVSGHTTIAGTQIHDWNWVGWGRLTFLGAIEKSSNVGFAKIAEKLGWPDLLKFMKRFGYLNRTGIDLPNESNSLIFAPSQQGPVQLATSGFGQGIAVTPLQQMDGIATIANGGTLYKPRLASAIISPQTHQVIKRFKPTIVRQHVIPPTVASSVNQALIDDVNSPQGIDQSAYIAGYDVAGKTGTAQIANSKKGGYYSNRFNVSFIGYAPGWDPKVEVMVTVNWPKTSLGNTWGSTISAPIAKSIMYHCLQYYHIEPRLSASSAAASTSRPQPHRITHYVTIPDFIGQSSQQATKAALQDKLVPYVMNRHSGTVVSQWPQSGVEVSHGDSVYLSTSKTQNGKTVIVPNLIGNSMRDAAGILNELGLKMSSTGTGYVKSQSVRAGTVVSKGTRISLTFTPNSI